MENVKNTKNVLSSESLSLLFYSYLSCTSKFITINCDASRGLKNTRIIPDDLTILKCNSRGKKVWKCELFFFSSMSQLILNSILSNAYFVTVSFAPCVSVALRVWVFKRGKHCFMFVKYMGVFQLDPEHIIFLCRGVGWNGEHILSDAVKHVDPWFIHNHL